MKKSGVMLLAGAGFVFLVLLSLTIFFKVKIVDFLSATQSGGRPTVEGTGVLDSREFDYTGFDRLHFDDLWYVEITGGDSFSIVVEADKALLDGITVDQRGNELFFSCDSYLSSGSSDSGDIHAKIVMPDLERLEFTGMGQVRLNHFALDKLSIVNSGASNIDGSDVTIDSLDLTVNGAANAELFDMNVRNCRLDISGAASIKLNMDGGELTGKVSGAASVLYKGTVSDESVSMSGIGSLKRQ